MKTPEIGQLITGTGVSGRHYTGSFLGASPDGGQYRIALKGAGKVFIGARTSHPVTETCEHDIDPASCTGYGPAAIRQEDM